MYKYDGKTLAEFCEDKKIRLRESVDTWLSDVADEVSEKFIFAPGKGTAFCASKEEGTIVFYECDRKRKTPILSVTGSFEIGNEDFTGKREDAAYFLAGRSGKNMLFLFGKDDFSDYPNVLDMHIYGIRSSCKEETAFVHNLIKQLKREEQTLPLTKEEEELLSYPDAEGPFPFAEKKYEFSTQYRYSYKLEYLGGEKEIYRLSYIPNPSPRVEEDEKRPLHKIFLFKEEGKTKIVLFVRNIKGQWRKEKKTVLNRILKTYFTRFFVEEGEEDFGPLKYLGQKTDSARIFLDGATYGVVEKIFAFPEIAKELSHLNVKHLCSYPKKESLEEAFGLSMGQIATIDRMFFFREKVFHANPYEVGPGDIFQMLQTLVKEGKGKARRINRIDFKKLLLGMLFLKEGIAATFAIYKGKELFEKTLCLCRDLFDTLEKNLKEITEIYQKEEALQQVNLLNEENKKKGFTLSSFGMEHLYLNLHPMIELAKGKEAEELLDSLLFCEEGEYRDYWGYEPHFLLQNFLFFPEEEKETFSRFIEMLKKLSEKEREERIIRGTLSAYPEGPTLLTIYKDMVHMASRFSKEELAAMDISLKPGRGARKVAWAHDRLAALYQAKKDGLKDEALLAIKEKNEDLLLEGEKFLLRMPETVEELAKEGTELGHCVASYGKKILNKQCKIFFVREKEAPDTPLCTVELVGKNIRQIQGKQHTYPRITSTGKDGEIFSFIQQWAEKEGFSIEV